MIVIIHLIFKFYRLAFLTGLFLLVLTASSPVQAEITAQAALTGSKPFINILCKFNDINAEPQPPSYFQGLFGSTYPGLDNYWREVSNNNLNLQGSATYGWVTLPFPRYYYFPDGHLPDWIALGKDCVEEARITVDFQNFYGINMLFNAELDGTVWVGSQKFIMDGYNKSWPVIMAPPWGYSYVNNGGISGQIVLAREMGKLFGLEPPADPAGSIDGNAWDMTSDTSNKNCAANPVYGCIAQGLIAYQRDRLGWIPPERKLVYNGNYQKTVTLERLNNPTNAGYTLVQVNVPGSTSRFVTIEARYNSGTNAGYDQNLPGSAVIIHQVDTSRAGGQAQLLGTNGNTGAMWSPGTTAVCTIVTCGVDLVIRVDSAVSGTGFQITLNPLTPPTNLSASVTVNKQVNLSWTISTGTVLKQSLERATSENGPWTEVNGSIPAGTGTYLDTAPLEGTQYYRVRACAGGNECSAYSNTANVILPLLAPGNLLAVPVSTTSVALVWSDLSQLNEGYVIEYRSGQDNFTILTTLVSPTATGYTNTGLTDGVNYTFRLKAYGSGYQDSAYSNEASATPGVVFTVSEPEDNGSGAVNTLSWAIQQVNSGGGGIIVFSHSITLTAGLPAITAPATLFGSCSSGPGITIKTAASSKGLVILGKNVFLFGLWLDTTAPNSGPGITNTSLASPNSRGNYHTRCIKIT